MMINRESQTAIIQDKPNLLAKAKEFLACYALIPTDGELVQMKEEKHA